jgi:hypothetical protein
VLRPTFRAAQSRSDLGPRTVRLPLPRILRDDRSRAAPEYKDAPDGLGVTSTEKRGTTDASRPTNPHQHRASEFR